MFKKIVLGEIRSSLVFTRDELVLDYRIAKKKNSTSFNYRIWSCSPISSFNVHILLYPWAWITVLNIINNYNYNLYTKIKLTESRRSGNHFSLALIVMKVTNSISDHFYIFQEFGN